MGSELVDWLTAGGTVGAAAFAGWAAWSSGAAARQTRRLVEIEGGRDLERVEAERIAQAQRVSVTLMTEELLDEGGQVGVDFHLVAVNASDSPIFKVRVGVVAGDGAWGPQLCGNLVPGQRVELYARIYTNASLDNTDASIRFVDVNDRAWVATARAPAEPTSADPAEWIARGRDFAQRELDLFERGMWTGLATPDFDDWRAGVHQRSLEAE